MAGMMHEAQMAGMMHEAQMAGMMHEAEAGMVGAGSGGGVYDGVDMSAEAYQQYGGEEDFVGGGLLSSAEGALLASQAGPRPTTAEHVHECEEVTTP